MARELTIHDWCDACLRVGRKTPARSVTLAVDGGKARQVDLCDEHRRELVTPLLVALMTYGVDVAKLDAPEPKTKQRGRAKGPFRCLVESCDWPPLKHRGTLTQHLRGLHDLDIDDYRERYGELVPMTSDELAALNVEARCELDDCEQVYSTALGNKWPQIALRSHQIAVHGTKARR